ncbi:GDP-mannose 4,6-dehydratase [Spirosoma luteolum]
MTILLTGAAGFIGSHLTEHLLSLGHTLIGLDNFDDQYAPAIKEANLQLARLHPSFHLVRGDVRDRPLLNRLFRHYPIEAVIHLAARTGVRASVHEPGLCLDVNINGTLTLLEAMRAAGVGQLVLASSSSVYGDSDRLPFREDDPADQPLSPYAQSKRAAELLAHTYHHLYGFSVSCLRFFTVYGPRQRPEMAISQFTANLYRARPITLYGDGTTARNYTYIDDTVAGIRLALDKPDGFRILNIGGPSSVSLIQLVRLLEETTGRPARIDWQAAQPGDVQYTAADLEQSFSTICYKPNVTIREGISQYITWFRSAVEPVRTEFP